MTKSLLSQEAPYPTVLQELVESLSYKRGWRFQLKDMNRGQGSSGLTFLVTTLTEDSLTDDPDFRVNHLFIVPAASYSRDSWMRWLLDRIIEIESHEACEFFKIDGDRVYAPHHSEGEDPYIIWQIGDRETAAKRFTDK